MLTFLQDILGLHQDADVAIGRLHRLAAQEDALGPETIFAMGEIAERYRQGMIDLRARFPKAYRRVTWATLESAPEGDRGEAPPVPSSGRGLPRLCDEAATGRRARWGQKNHSHWLGEDG